MRREAVDRGSTRRGRAPGRAPVLISAVISVAIAVVVLGPALLQPGSVLRGDMVFVPRQLWKPAWLGLDGQVPRAVPMDALVSVATHVLHGGWVQKLVLLGSFVGAGTGIARLAVRLTEGSVWGCAAATTAYLWNPWVVERLSIGQWATVAGYAVLPWVVLAALHVRADLRRWHGLFLVLALSAVCSPSSGITAVLVAAAVTATRRGALWTLVLGGVANAPWLVPAMTLGDQVDLSGDGGFAAFGATAESSLGVLASVASLGGIWKTSIVPGERTSELVVAMALVVSVVSVTAFWRSRGDTVLKRSLLAAAALSVVLAVVPAWAPEVLSQTARVVPGTAVLRDSHRYLPPLALVLALGLAQAVATLRREVGGGREALLVPMGMLVVAPALLLPSAVWGLAGDLRPVRYPGEWDAVASAVASEPGTTVVLPWAGSYRRFGWNDDRASLDPAPRLLPGEVLIDDRIVLPGETLSAEDPRAALVSDALDQDDASSALRSLGVRWVLVEKPVPPEHAAPAGTVVHDGRWLTLVDLGQPAASVDPREHGAGRSASILAVDTVWLILLIVCIPICSRRGYASIGQVTGE